MPILTEKQKRFADYYIETGNATESARRAGYSLKTARVIGGENLLKPAIRAYIDEQLAQKDNERIASADEVLQLLTSIARGEIEEDVLKGIGGGEQVIVKKELDGKDRLKAAELLGKRYGLFVEKLDIKGEVVVFKGEEKLPD
jgi:phage terminase small subunit